MHHSTASCDRRILRTESNGSVDKKIDKVQIGEAAAGGTDGERCHS